MNELAMFAREPGTDIGAAAPGPPPSAREDAMHPMFAELFLTPEDTLDADERRRLRRTRRSRQLRTVSAARGKAGAASAALARRQPS